MGVRIMRLLVMFDLPTGNKAERKSYADFRKFLIEDGYTMMQFSVYSRVLLSRDSADAHVRRIKAHVPKAGAVTVLELTEKQFEDRISLVDTRPAKTVEVGSQLTLSF